MSRVTSRIRDTNGTLDRVHVKKISKQTRPWLFTLRLLKRAPVSKDSRRPRGVLAESLKDPKESQGAADRSRSSVRRRQGEQNRTGEVWGRKRKNTERKYVYISLEVVLERLALARKIKEKLLSTKTRHQAWIKGERKRIAHRRPSLKRGGAPLSPSPLAPP